MTSDPVEAFREQNRAFGETLSKYWGAFRDKYPLTEQHQSTTCRDCHGLGHLSHDNTIECPRCGGEGRV